MTTHTETVLAATIRDGYRRGWSFTPLAGKRPKLKRWQSRPRESLAEALDWAAEGNVGLRTGRISGTVVVDADPGADVESLGLPETVTAITGRENARHFYFHHRGRLGNSAGKLGEHIDVKADGGQVVLPGSIHPDTGRAYAWAEGHAPWEIELAPLPEPIAEMLRPADPPPSRPTPRDDEPGGNGQAHYAEVALQTELRTVRNAPPGERNNTLNRAAFNLGQLVAGGCLSENEVVAQLTDAARASGLADDEIDPTIRSGLAGGAERPRRPEPRERAVPVPSPRPAASEYILLPGPHTDDSGEHVEQSGAAFAGEVLARLPADGIYRKDFVPGEILGRVGARKWVELTADRMRLLVDTSCKLAKWVKRRDGDGRVRLYQACSKDAAGVVLAHARQAECVRDLDLMVSYPVYGPGWRRIPPGYHDGLFYDEPRELADLEPETDCEVISAVLDDLVTDFPFKAPADRQNFYGLLLTPLVAPALDGQRPMHLINAPLERTGKSKLVNEVFGGIITGRDTPSMQITEREEEREKRILAMLFQGETLMHLDNLPRWIDSASLASLLTTHRFMGRLLGHSRNVTLANRLTLVGTGNNVAASGEIAKRIVPICLQPIDARPEARTDFLHPDIRAHVRAQRKLVLRCLLGLVENWRAAGRPRHGNRLGGFESWSETIGGILQANGFVEWRANEKDWRAMADPQGAEMEAFVQAWREAYGLSEVTPRELRDLAEENELFGHLFANRTRRAISVAFGRMLRRHVDMPVGECFIRYRNNANHPVYRLEDIE